jgi:hypothetical protein
VSLPKFSLRKTENIRLSAASSHGFKGIIELSFRSSLA